MLLNGVVIVDCLHVHLTLVHLGSNLKVDNPMYYGYTVSHQWAILIYPRYTLASQ